jgi:hypothetical protein
VRRYRFFAHFNRINMQRGNPNVWTLHFRGMCFQAESIKFNVPITTDFKPNGRQPRATLRGECHVVLSSSDDKRLIVQ